MRHRILRLAAFCATLWLAACASVDITPKLDLDHANADELFKAERAHLTHRPRIGLALAGGGTRAALYAHGILYGLNEAKILPHIDIISSVSGGGYAAMWYYTKLLENRNDPSFKPEHIFADCWADWRHGADDADPIYKAMYERIFAQARAAEPNICYHPPHFRTNDPYRWQAHLLRWPDLFGTTYTVQYAGAQPAPLADTRGLVLRALAEITVGWTGLIDSGIPDAYQAGIERTWGLNPLPRTEVVGVYDRASSWHYSNAETSPTATYTPRMGKGSATFTQLRSLYTSDTAPPLWILQATMADRPRLPNLNNLYEISPFIHGTPDPAMGGFITGPLPATLDEIPTAVRASAGFADKQNLGPGLAHTALSLMAKIVPAATWGVDVKLENNKTVRLSDGGGTDNLGLLALVRRQLDHIIVADSGLDEYGNMEDICWAKKALEQEGHILTFDALDDFEKVCAATFDRTPREKRLGYNISLWFNPVVEGRITSRATGRVTHVWLLKPAWNQQAVRRAFNTTTGVTCGLPPEHIPCGLLLQFANNSVDKNGFQNFPQTGTFSNTLNSSSYRTLAFRELGRMHTAHLVWSEDKGLSLTPGFMPLHQPALAPQTSSNRSGPKMTCSGPQDNDYCGTMRLLQ